jgi:hypothetical protein
MVRRGGHTPRPTTEVSDTVHLANCTGKETTKCAGECRRAEKESEPFLRFRAFIPH